MPQIRIECIKDFANFKAGEVFEFNKSCFLVGTNGSGKTTLLSALRASLTDPNDKGYWDQRHSKYTETLEYFSVTTDISKNKTLFLFGREDSGESQSYDAYSFVVSRGYWAEHQSRGEAAIGLLNRTLGTDKDAIKERVLIFDEADTGLDLKSQVKFGKNLISNLVNKFDCFMLVTSHNYLTLLSSNLPIYLLDKREYVTVEQLKEFFKNDN